MELFTLRKICGIIFQKGDTMNYNQLFYFITTVKYNSITKASKELHISQPGISSAIKSLENEFNTQLFIRKNNILTLTDAGKLLYDEGLKLIDNFNQLNLEMKKFINENRVLNIGIPPMIGTFLFPKIFNEFSKNNKNIKLITKEFGSISLIKALKENEIDLAITSVGDSINDDELNTHYLLSTELLFCVGPNHPLAKNKIISIPMLKDTPLVLLKEGSYQHIAVTKKFEKYNIKPNTILTSNQLYTIKQLLSYNEVGAFMFKEIVDKDKDLIGIELDDPINVDIAIVYSKKIKDKTSTYESIQKFIEFVQSLKNK